jgi:hypothetical protein
MPIAPEKDLPGVNKIAIFDCTVMGGVNETGLGTKVSDFMAGELVVEVHGVNVNGWLGGLRSNIFELYDRTQTRSVLDTAQLSRFAVQSGVQCVIYGSVSYTYADVPSSTSTTVKNVVTTTYHLTRTVTSSAQIKMVDAKTGRIIASINDVQKANSSLSGETRPNPAALERPEVLAESCFRATATRAAKYITPYYTGFTIELKKPKNKEYQKMIDDVKELIKQREHDRAFENIYCVLQQDQHNPALYFVAGAFYEIAGQYDKAIEHYNRAYSLDPERVYIDARKRAEKTKETWAYLNERYGMQYSVHEYPEPDCRPRPKFLRVKGNKSTRKPVYAEQSKDADIKTEVPGGILVEVVGDFPSQRIMDFINIKLLDGQEGFMLNKDLSEE